jgi:hypothetical protein
VHLMDDRRCEISRPLPHGCPLEGGDLPRLAIRCASHPPSCKRDDRTAAGVPESNSLSFTAGILTSIKARRFRLRVFGTQLRLMSNPA